MDICLVTTTINVPHVLRRYRELGPGVPFIIAGDRKSPHEEIRALADEIGDCRYLTLEEQSEAHPVLSTVIGTDCIMRRNIAILEAAKLRPDVIVTVDDDNEPIGDYFAEVRTAFEQPFNGSLASGAWFNIGELAEDAYRYRGYPYSVPPRAEFARMNGSAARIGVVNGLIHGDPDINATQRIELGPVVRGYDTRATKGIAVNPRTTWTPINSQNTAWRAELAPLMLLPPGIGRYDDIWGSYIAQRVMEATDYHVLFGRPFVRQERNVQDVYRNLEDEIYGMRYTDRFVRCLKSVPVDRRASVLDNLAVVCEALGEFDLLRFCKAWLEAWE